MKFIIELLQEKCNHKHFYIRYLDKKICVRQCPKCGKINIAHSKDGINYV